LKATGQSARTRSQPAPACSEAGSGLLRGRLRRLMSESEGSEAGDKDVKKRKIKAKKV
jgi:hypothetical protein